MNRHLVVLAEVGRRGHRSPIRYGPQPRLSRTGQVSECAPAPQLCRTEDTHKVRPPSSFLTFSLFNGVHARLPQEWKGDGGGIRPDATWGRQ